MDAVSSEFQKQKCSASLSTELPVDSVRITSTRSSPIAKGLSGLEPIAVFVVTIRTRHASKQLATMPTQTLSGRSFKRVVVAVLPAQIAGSLSTTLRQR